MPFAKGPYRHAIFLFTVLVLGDSCGGRREPIRAQIDSELAPLFASFQEDARQAGLELSSTEVHVRLVDEYSGPLATQDYIGICQMPAPGDTETLPTVSIRKSFWNHISTSAESRRATLYHELGHCILERGHLADRIVIDPLGTTVPISLMYPRSFVDSSPEIHAFHERWEGEYLNELFGKPSMLTDGLFPRVAEPGPGAASLRDVADGDWVISSE